VLKKKGEGEKSNQVSGEPVGLAESGENPVLDILNPEMFVDTEVFKNAVDRDEGGGAEEGMKEVN